MADKDITLTQKGGNLEGREETRTRESYIKPVVDIYETEEGLTLVADLPGVEREGLTVDIDKGILTLKGKAQPSLRGELVHREFALVNYYRQFQLPDEIDVDKVSAQLKDGVLTLGMPKAEAARPRRVEIRAA